MSLKRQAISLAREFGHSRRTVRGSTLHMTGLFVRTNRCCGGSHFCSSRFSPPTISGRWIAARRVCNVNSTAATRRHCLRTILCVPTADNNLFLPPASGTVRGTRRDLRHCARQKPRLTAQLVGQLALDRGFSDGGGSLRDLHRGLRQALRRSPGAVLSLSRGTVMFVD